MSRYIDADALIKDIESKRLVFTDKATLAEALLSQGTAIRKAIENAPTADVIERKRGEWKKLSHHILGTHFDCSVCKCEWYVDGMRIDDDVNLAFCPNCGADMRGE